MSSPASTVPAAPGTTHIGLRGVERVVTKAVNSVPGTAPVDSKLAGLAGRGFPRLTIQMDPESQTAAVDCEIAAVWPSPITRVAEHTRATITEALKAFTGYDTTRVNVLVALTVPGQRVPAEMLAAAPHAFAAIPTVRPSAVVSPEVKASNEHLAAIDVRELNVTSPRTAASTALKDVEYPEDHQPRPVAEPQPVDVRPATPATPVSVASVDVPAAGELKPCGEIRPRFRSAASELSAEQMLPAEGRLRDIEVSSPQPLRTPQVPEAGQLAPVRVKPFNPVHVYAPRPKPLREIEIRKVEVRAPEIIHYTSARRSR